MTDSETPFEANIVSISLTREAGPSQIVTSGPGLFVAISPTPMPLMVDIEAHVWEKDSESAEGMCNAGIVAAIGQALIDHAKQLKESNAQPPPLPF